ncbi:MFS transporter [Micrococcales bacterium 31B]|nr:MFS transporter [Micrococcales bacterium 31B]
MSAANTTALGRPLIVLMAVTCGLSVAQIYYVQPLLPQLARDFGVAEASTTWIVSATQIGYAVAMLLLIPLGDKYSTRTLVTGFLVLSALAAVSMGLSWNLATALALALVIGVASITAQFLIPLVAEYAPPEQRGALLGQVMTGLLSGILLSRVASSMLAQVATWRLIYFLSAAGLIMLLVALRAMLPERRARTDLPYAHLIRSTLAQLRHHPELVRRALYQASMFGSFTVFWTIIAFVLQGPALRFDEFQVGLFALLGAGGIFITPLAGRWNDRGHGTLVLRGSFAMVAAMWALAAFSEAHLAPLALAAVLLDAAVQASMNANQTVIFSLDAAARSRINSIYIAVFFTAGAACSAIAGGLYHVAGWRGVCAFGAVMPLASLAADFSRRRRASA